jgi:hypothetical protein
VCLFAGLTAFLTGTPSVIAPIPNGSP